VSDLICEEISRRAGFAVSVGNWIAPDGAIICGTNYETHHWETIKEHFKGEVKTDNQLEYMNKIIHDGFIRLVFRADVCFQVGCDNVDELWSEQLNYKRMISILEAIKNIEGVDIHIFSKHFYMIGSAVSIITKDKKKLQIKVQP